MCVYICVLDNCFKSERGVSLPKPRPIQFESFSFCSNMSKSAVEVCPSRLRCFYSNNVLGVSVNWEKELTQCGNAQIIAHKKAENLMDKGLLQFQKNIEKNSAIRLKRRVRLFFAKPSFHRIMHLNPDKDPSNEPAT